MQRRLAAVLAADVAGYSRLMGADEEGTLATLKRHRAELFDPTIAEHRGRIVKTTGDGLLVEFVSVVEAVRCAVAVQQGMAERNATVPEERCIAFRIGINFGDIILDGDDIFGDGINVAARLEPLAEPGGVCISGKVFDEVRNKLDHTFEDMGERTVKNIARPVRVWRWTAVAGGGRLLPVPEKPSIAVLPFDNMSGDTEQEYFSDGITEDLITDLSKISGLFVIARNSSFVYKKRAVNVLQVGRELGVRYVLEGSVRKAGSRVRITAQLSDCTTGGHLWAERYDRDLTDIFAVQDEVTQQIVSALALKLTADEARRLAGKGTENPEAYDYFLRGREQMWRHTAEATVQARSMLARAVELDPQFAAATAFLAWTYAFDYINQVGKAPEHGLQKAHELAQRAVALDASEPQAHFVLGITYMWLRQHEQAVAEGERSVALDPNFAPGYSHIGLSLHYAGRSEEALEFFKKTMRLDPHYPDVYLHFLGQCYFMMGRYEEAIAVLRRRIIHNPSTDASRVLLAASYGHLGRVAESWAVWAEVFGVSPNYSLEHRRQILPYKNPMDFERIVDGLRRVGLVA